MIELLKAFLQAKQGFLEPAKSGKSNYKPFSTIEDINTATFKSLSANNLIVIPTVKDNILSVRLYHTLTGQWIEECRALVSEKPGNQAIGSANTYMLRYALKNLLNICGNDDEDEAQAEQDYIDKQKKTIALTEKPVSLLFFNNVKEHVIKNNMQDDIKELFSIDFSSDKIKITQSKLTEIVNFIKSKKEDTHV